MEGVLTIVEAIEHVQEHRADISPARPIHLRSRLWRRLRSCIPLLPCVPATPDNHCDRKEYAPNYLCFHTSSQLLEVQPIPKYVRSSNLAGPVKDTVERSRPDVEFGRVKGIELVSVEPIASEEHREEADDPDVRFEYF